MTSPYLEPVEKLWARLTGVSLYNQEVLRAHGLEGRLAVYNDDTDAVMGGCPRRPR